MTERITSSEYHDRIASLAPALRERAGEAEKQRRLSQETVDELVAAGLYRAYLPARFGGPELFMAEVIPLITQIARACPATAWVLAIMQMHTWFMGLYPQRAQDEVFRDDSDTLTRRVDDPGYG